MEMNNNASLTSHISHRRSSGGHTRVCIGERSAQPRSLASLFPAPTSASMLHCAQNRGARLSREIIGLRFSFTVALCCHGACAWTHSRGGGCTYSPAGVIGSQNSTHSSQETEPSLPTWSERMRCWSSRRRDQLIFGSWVNRPRGHRGPPTSETGTDLNNAAKNTLPSSPKDDPALERKLHQNKSTS